MLPIYLAAALHFVSVPSSKSSSGRTHPDRWSLCTAIESVAGDQPAWLLSNWRDLRVSNTDGPHPCCEPDGDCACGGNHSGLPNHSVVTNQRGALSTRIRCGSSVWNCHPRGNRCSFWFINGGLLWKSERFFDGNQQLPQRIVPSQHPGCNVGHTHWTCDLSPCSTQHDST